MQSKLIFVLSWIINRRIDAESFTKWADAHKDVDLIKVAKDENIISSHIFFKQRIEEERKMCLKARLYFLENRETFKNGVRKNSATSHIHATRSLLSTATALIMDRVVRILMVHIYKVVRYEKKHTLGCREKSVQNMQSCGCL